MLVRNFNFKSHSVFFSFKMIFLSLGPLAVVVVVSVPVGYFKANKLDAKMQSRRVYNLRLRAGLEK